MYLDIDKDSNITLTKQLYHQIKEKVLTGDLSSNQKLLSSRKLAGDLGISRNVVLDAYNQLIAEGYLYSKDRSGLFVSKGTQLDVPQDSYFKMQNNIIGLQYEPKCNAIDFRTGIPNLAIFPKEKWGKIYRQVCMDLPVNHLDYYEPRGCYELRQQLASYLSRVRGVKCSPEQILITNGAAQGFNLLVKYFSKINKKVLVEDPLSSGITKILKYFEMNVITINVDKQGIRTDHLQEDQYNNINPSLIFTTPSHQFPTGGVLPINRRIQLVNYARAHNSYIVEDDYDSEFRYEGYPIASMQSLAPENIIYIGTFTKMLFPALRIGYMVIPKKLIPKMMEAKYIGDLHSPILDQLTLARFIECGLLHRHVEISRKHYSKKCKFLINKLKESFGDTINIFGHTGGIHLMVQFKTSIITDDLLIELKNKGVFIKPANEHQIKNNTYSNCLLFGFGNTPEDKIEEGILIIKNIIAKNK